MTPLKTSRVNHGKKKKRKEPPKIEGGAYKKSYDLLAFKLALLGCTYDEIGLVFEVSGSCINDWTKEHESFGKQIERGGLLADANVSYGLYQRAVGYEFKETKVLASMGEIFREEVTVHIPPDVKAATIWLMNRQRKKWTLAGQEEAERKALENARVVSDQEKTVLSENPAEASRQYLEFVQKSGK